MLVPELRSGRRALRGPEAHHLRDVLRAREGTEVEAFDGRGHEAYARIVSVDAHSVVLAIDTPRASTVEPPVALTLAVALLKGDKLSEVVRRGTELGVARFRLFASRRTDAGAPSAAKLQRFRRVAEEAARQSRRALVPEVAEPVELDELDLGARALVAVPAAGGRLRDVLGEPRTAALTCVTGPEGGLEPAEVEALVARGVEAVRLGPRVLRAETAPVAMAAAILLPEAL